MTIFRLSVFTICAKLKRLIFSAILALVLFSSIILPPLQVQAQTTGDTNIFGSVGFRECTFTDTIRTGSDVDSVRTGGTLTVAENQFQQCIQTIFRFFFVIAIFLIAIRIAVEAFAGINPMVGGKEVDNSIGLIRDVTIGLILIGSPSLFLSFLNPATLSIQQLINLNGIGLRDTNTSRTTGGNGTSGNTDNQVQNPQNTPVTSIKLGSTELNEQDFVTTIKNGGENAERLINSIGQSIVNGTISQTDQSKAIELLINNKVSEATIRQTLKESASEINEGGGRFTNKALLDRYSIVKTEPATNRNFMVVDIKCKGLSSNAYRVDGSCNKRLQINKEDIDKCAFLKQTEIVGKLNCRVYIEDK